MQAYKHKHSSVLNQKGKLHTTDPTSELNFDLIKVEDLQQGFVLFLLLLDTGACKLTGRHLLLLLGYHRWPFQCWGKKDST